MRKLAMLLALVAPVWAQAAPPDELKSVFHSAKPYAAADMRYLFIKVYHIELWTNQPAWTPQVPFALSIVYAMNFSSDELWQRTCEEMGRQQPDGQDICQAARKTHAAAMPDVAEGDRITALHTPEGTTRFYKNGTLTETIKAPEFSGPFFAIWLGKHTSEPALRRKLLGKQ